MTDSSGSRYTVDYLKGHRSQVNKYGTIAGVIVAGIAIWAFLGWREQPEGRVAASLHHQMLSLVTRLPVAERYKTQLEKENAALKAFSDVAAKNSGSRKANSLDSMLPRFSAMGARWWCKPGSSRPRRRR
jgi:hypothetical protein